MKVTVPMLFVISMGVAGLMLSGSGFNDMTGIDRSTGLADDTHGLNENTTNYSVDRDAPGGGASYLGFTTEATSALVSMAKWTLFLPGALVNLGFPSWFAVPLGAPLQFVNYIGIWQIIRGMKII